MLELHERDRFVDLNSLNSLNFLRGNICSMVAGFKTEIASMISFSESAPAFFGYQKKDLETMSSINFIMPNAIAVMHDEFIQRIVGTGETHIIRKYRGAIAKNKDGFIFPISIYVNYYWHLYDDFCFSGLILKLRSQSQFILLDKFGYIEEYS